MGSEAAHHADVGLDAVEAQARPLHDAVVGADVQLVALVEPLGVAVEGVGVLHDELARAQHARARARLVALLDLEVVEDQGQVAVGAHDLGDVRGDGLLVGQREHELRALAVAQLEQLLDRIAPGLAPRLGRLQDGHQHLLGADRVHLLADDLNRALMDPPAGWQPRPHPGPDLADQAGSDHQLVRDRLRVGRRLLLGGKQVFGEAGHVGRRPARTSGASAGHERIRRRAGASARSGRRAPRQPAGDPDRAAVDGGPVGEPTRC